MLKKAAKRCHATPQTSLRPTSSRNRPPDIILMNAKTDTMIGLSGSSWATFMVKKSDEGWLLWKVAILPDFTRTMPRPSTRTIISIVYAAKKLEPPKRDSRSGFRGWLSCRMMIRVTMPMTVPIPRSSSHRCHRKVSPMIGQWNSGLKVWPYDSK
ncbi:Uncharacterised protein [Mycobacteroides abscessus subsp. abscessus]|nr:Uncharacterised protein [Mycobacteroides abscessus subsp. abscessus]